LAIRSHASTAGGGLGGGLLGGGEGSAGGGGNGGGGGGGDDFLTTLYSRSQVATTVASPLAVKWGAYKSSMVITAETSLQPDSYLIAPANAKLLPSSGGPNAWTYVSSAMMVIVASLLPAIPAMKRTFMSKSIPSPTASSTTVPVAEPRHCMVPSVALSSAASPAGVPGEMSWPNRMSSTSTRPNMTPKFSYVMREMLALTAYV